jgi:transposase
MGSAQHRHDISEHVWELLEPHLPSRKGSWGGKARDNRQFINVVSWILRTGAPWRDLPPSYGDWKNTHRRFCRWRDKGIWESLPACLIGEVDYEWLMIDASYVKAHTHASGARGSNQGIRLAKGGATARTIWPWMRMVCRSEYLLQRVSERIAQRQAS